MQGQQYQKKRSQRKQHRTPLQRNIILPGLLFGILLALFQLALVFVGPVFHLVPIFDNASVVLFIWFYDLVIPGLLAFFWTNETQDPYVGYNLGAYTGVYCTITLIVMAVAYMTFSSFLGQYYFLALLDTFLFVLFISGVGGLLSALGAFLGSRRRRM
jgi:hypothetical protein